jgi:FKBP-type peptidyl-prolyl cis-trans isomerase 2
LVTLAGCGRSTTDVAAVETVALGDTITLEYRLGWDNESTTFASNQGDAINAKGSDFVEQFVASTVTVGEKDTGPFTTLLVGQEIGESRTGVLTTEDMDTIKDHTDFLIQKLPSVVATNQGVEPVVGAVISVDDEDAVIIEVNDATMMVDLNLRHTYTPVWYELTVTDITDQL